MASKHGVLQDKRYSHLVSPLLLRRNSVQTDCKAAAGNAAGPPGCCAPPGWLCGGRPVSQRALPALCLFLSLGAVTDLLSCSNPAFLQGLRPKDTGDCGFLADSALWEEAVGVGQE